MTVNQTGRFPKGNIQHSWTGKQAHREEAWRCLVKFSFCWSGALAASLWWSCGRSPLPLLTQHLEDLLVCSLLDLYKGSRCCRSDTQRPSPYLWPCSSLRRSGSCWNETWHSVLQTGHWSDSSRCGNGVSGHLKAKKQKRHFQNIVCIHIKLSLILYCWFQLCIVFWILVNLSAFKFALCDIWHLNSCTSNINMILFKCMNAGCLVQVMRLVIKMWIWLLVDAEMEKLVLFSRGHRRFSYTFSGKMEET